MEREIIFRGKRLDNGELGSWVEGNLSIEHYPEVEGRPERWECSISVPKVGAPWHSSVYRVDPATVGQYTGLTDRNGKKIFEGSILKLTDYHGSRTVHVFYGKSVGCWMYGGDGYSDEYIFISSDKEIVGNIYDNPELMEMRE